MDDHGSTGNAVHARAACAAVLLIALGALVLRLHGIDFQLPHATFSDGRVLVDQTAALRAGAPEPTGHRLYPHLVPLVASWYPRGAAPTGGALAEHLARAAAPFRELRIVSVLLSLLALPATYLLARRFLERPASLFATALLATSLLHVSFSQQERPHAAVTSFTALAVLAALRLRRRPSPGSYLLAGVAAALAVGSLHNGLAVLPPLAAAHLLRRREPGRRTAWRIAVPLAVVALAVRCFYPFHFERHLDRAADLEFGKRGGAEIFNLSGHFVSAERFDGGGFRTVADTLYSYDPLLAVLIVVGLAAWILRLRARAGSGAGNEDRRRDLLVILAYAVPYLVAIGLYGKTPERFVMPLLPCCAVLAASGAAALVRRPAARHPLASWLAVFLPLAAPTAFAWRLGAVRAADDTYTRAAAWIREHVAPERERVALLLDPFQDLPLFTTASSLGIDAAWPWPSRWALYQQRLGTLEREGPVFDLRVPELPDRRPDDLARDPVSFLRELGAEYAVVEIVQGGPRSRTQRLVHEGIAAGAEQLFRVGPGGADEGAGRLSFRLVSSRRTFVQRILGATCMGPTLEIYRLE